MKRLSLLVVGGFSLLACESPCGENEVGEAGLCYQIQETPLETNVSDVVTGDFNGDNLADMAVTTGATLKLFLNNNGSFETREFPLIASSVALTSGDIDNDGDLDLVVSDFELLVTPFENDGQANFTARESFLLEHLPKILAVADLNQDQLPDIVVGTSFGFLEGSVLSFLQTNGSFSLASSHLVYASPTKFHIRDIDEDGDIDIEADSIELLSLARFRFTNPGDGLLTEPTKITTSGFLDDSVISEFADLDQDGASDTVSLIEEFDLIRTRPYPIKLNVALSSSRNETISLQSSSQNDSFLESLSLFDIDSDSDLDSVVVLERSDTPEDTTISRIFLVENNDSGRFGKQVELSLVVDIDRILAADFNLDGQAEIIILDQGQNLFLLSSVR